MTMGAKPDNEIIQLDDNLILGEGGHRLVYIHPQHPNQCIKVARKGHAPESANDKKEMAYRRARKFRNLPPSELLTQYFGTVQTSQGLGYVFERVCDYDGVTSMTIEELILAEQKARDAGVTTQVFLGTPKQLPTAVEALLRFRKDLFRENIVIPDMGAFNYMVQFGTPTTWRVRIVDDIGSPTLIPIVYFIDYFAAGHVRRRWKKFIREIMNLYPGFLSADEQRQLLDF